MEMNRKKVFVVIAVLLAALVNTSFMVAAQAEEKTGTSLYIQNAKSGFFIPVIPVEGEKNLYILTLKDVSTWTIHITDTPEYATTKLHTRIFLDTVDFSHEPLSAVIELIEGHEEADLITVRLTEPVYNPEEETLKYKAEIISHDYAPEYVKRHVGEDLVARVDEGIPGTFGDVIVYIHSKEPVKKIVSRSGSTQRFSVITAVIGSLGWEVFGPTAAYAYSSKKCDSTQHFDVGIEDFADVEGTLCFKEADTSLDVELKFFGITVKSYQIDRHHLNFCKSVLLAEGCVTAKMTSWDPPHGSLTFKGRYRSWGSWTKWYSKKVIGW